MASVVAVQSLSGTYRAQPVPSSFAFAVRHSGVFWYRGSLSDVTGTLRADGDALTLEGSARVDSISVLQPAAMRASVLGPDFFDAENHPEITFRSTAVRLADDGRAEVDGELTIKGVTRPVRVTGTVTAPMADPYGNDRIGLNLAAAVDRTDFGVNWNTPLPSGEPALANDVKILAELQFVKAAS